MWGTPGVGKSSVVRQAAAAAKWALVDVRATLLDPVDLRGLPRVLKDFAVWCPPAFPPKAGAGLLFLDELGQAPPLEQSACLQLTLDRRLGEYELPEGWAVIAAGNRAEDRAGAHRMISPLLNCFVHLDLEVSPDDWQAWAVAANVAAEVRAFLRFRPALLFDFKPAANPRAFPTPRPRSRGSRRCCTPWSARWSSGAGRGRPPLANFVAYATRLPDEFAMLAVRDALALNPKLASLPAVQRWVKDARAKGYFTSV